MNIPRVSGIVPAQIQMMFDRLIDFLRRWLTLSLDSASTLAALAAVDTASVSNGASKRVLSLRADFVLDKISEVAPDGTTVVAATGGGRWIRQAPTTPDKLWLDQTTWFIDPAAGSDEATGLVDAPVKTWAEIRRRVGDIWEVTHNVDVTWLGPNDATDLFVLDALMVGSGSLKVHGVKVTSYAGTVTSYVPHPPGGNVANILNGGIGFVPVANSLIEFIDGDAAGAACWVAKDLTGGLARTSSVMICGPDWSPDAHLATPAPGNHFRVVGLVSLWTSSINVRGVAGFPNGGNVQVYDLQLQSTGFDIGLNASTNEGLLVLTSVRCDYIGGNSFFTQNMCLTAGAETISGTWGCEGGLLSGTNVTTGILSQSVVGICCQGGSLVLRQGGRAFVNNDLAIFDSVHYGLQVGDGGFIRLAGELYGTDNANAAVNMYGNGSLIYQNSVPTIAGAGGADTVRIGGVNFTWAQMPYLSLRTSTWVAPAYNIVTANAALYANADIGRAQKSAVTRDGANHFVLPDGTEQANAGTTMPTVAYVVEGNGMLRNLRVHASAAPSAGQSCVVTLYRVAAGGGVSAATTLTVTLGAADTDKSDVTHTLFVSAGDLIVANQNSTAGSAAAGLSIAWEVS